MVLVVGADGSVGRALAADFEQAGHAVRRTTRRKECLEPKAVLLDLADPAFEDRLHSFSGLDTAILCAAVTSMEVCLKEPLKSWRVNVEHTVALARRLVDSGVFTIFLSSNAVFDGRIAFSKASDQPCPQTEYGRQKAEAERRLLNLGKSVAVVRFSKIVSPRMPLFLDWASDLRAGRAIQAFADSLVSPVSVAFAVEVLHQVARRRIAGITQVSARDELSYSDAAAYMAGRIGADPALVKPVGSGPGGKVKAPRHSTLDTSTLMALDLQSPSSTEALDQLDLGSALDENRPGMS